jgi:hypothetical protein
MWRTIVTVGQTAWRSKIQMGTYEVVDLTCDPIALREDIELDTLSFEHRK